MNASNRRDRPWDADIPDPAFAARYPHARQCDAPSRQTGQRCRLPAIPGGTVCARFHGGQLPNVRKAAQLRLLQLIDPAITVLAREMATAERSADRQRAANSILDRAGIPRAPSAPDAEVARAALVERLLAMRASHTAKPHEELEGPARRTPEV
ncbi:hypothetical protein [Raineyella fluvialis]|uniref:Uncharacterized protein n=1 Tax=Raineyella fluvialis TaxID=2662261 RepID=A0A5Q2F6Z4_9ACTN|nr:hypothetical protein [Raineyella fluvialis]QGF22438.1 hypothetical protein Rai3103_00640 [Raineyella fluvialis]